jgi:hypothetical protein
LRATHPSVGMSSSPMPCRVNPIAPSPRRTREARKQSRPWFAKAILCARAPTKIQNRRVPMTHLAAMLPWPVGHSCSVQTTHRQSPHHGQNIRLVCPTERLPGAIRSTPRPHARTRTLQIIRPRRRSRPRSPRQPRDRSLRTPNSAIGDGRVPQVRPSVPGPKKTGRRPSTALCRGRRRV